MAVMTDEEASDMIRDLDRQDWLGTLRIPTPAGRMTVGLWGLFAIMDTAKARKVMRLAYEDLDAWQALLAAAEKIKGFVPDDKQTRVRFKRNLRALKEMEEKTRI